MDLVEIIELRNTKIQELQNVVNTGKSESRKLNEVEESNVLTLQSEIDGFDKQIEDINNNKRNNKKIMENFNDLITRSADGKIENFSVRALTLANSIVDVAVAGNISVVGYEPFYKQMGVEILPNLTTAIKLPYVDAIIAGKVGEGARKDNDKAVATVLLSPNRYSVTETIGKELLSVGNEQALQAYLFEMAKGCDRAITADIFDVMSAATAVDVSGLSGYTTTSIDKLVGEIDGDVTILFPRSEFYRAKGVKAGENGLYLANKTNGFSGQMWDGTPLFYSNLFSGSVIAADLKHVTVGEFGNTVEVIFDTYTKAPEGQVVVTVCKMADVKLRNAKAARTASF